jgi:hypothetical protein
LRTKCLRKTKRAIPLLFIVMMAFPIVVQAQDNPNFSSVLIDSDGSGDSLALDSDGNPHVVFYHGEYNGTVDGSPVFISRLDYAVWIGRNWSIQTVDPAGKGGQIKLDSANRPHIIYISGRDGRELKYAVLKDGNWYTQTIDTSQSRIDYSMTLDSTSNPHVVYTKLNYDSNYQTTSDEIKYAVLNGTEWNIQPVDTVNSEVGYNELSIALDMNGNAQIIYLDNIEDTYNVKYAYLSDTNWKTQTVFKDAYHTGNLVLNSKGQPSFCYEQQSIPRTLNYGYWKGQEWVSRVICSASWVSGKNFLQLDYSENPQVYYYILNNQNMSDSGLMYAHLVGLNWTFENLGRIPNYDDFYFDSEGIADMSFNSQGKPVFTSTGVTGSVRGAWQSGGLNYITSRTPLTFTTVISEPNYLLSIVILAITVILASTMIVVLYKKKLFRKKRNISSINC